MSSFEPRFNTLQEVYEHATSSYSDRPLFGVKHDGEWVWSTYADFQRSVERVRSGLARLGVDKGDRVAIIAGNRPEWAFTAYGAYGLGAAIVPMYEAQRPEDWTYIIADSGATVVVCSDGNIAATLESRRLSIPQVRHIVPIEGDGKTMSQWTAEDGPVADVVGVSPDDVAGFVYTSGTTGNPKGVVLSHGNIARNVSAVGAVFSLPADTRTLSFLPWAHAFGQTVELHTILSLGLSTAFAESVRKIISNLPEVQPTMLVSVPTIFGRIYEAVNRQVEERGGVAESLFHAALAASKKRAVLGAEGKSNALLNARLAVLDRLVMAKIRMRFGGKLEFAITGGAAIPAEVSQFIDALGITVYEGYGLSETSPIVSANTPDARRSGTVGRPLPGIRVEIDQDVELDETGGEVIVYGHGVMQGYHNLSEESAKVFTEDGGLRTGDLGRVDRDGYLTIIGRVKEQYKLANGKYVVPGLIEEHLGLSRFIANAMVYGDNRPYNVALLVPNPSELEQWARNEGREFGHVSDNGDVQDLIRTEITSTTGDIVRGYERIRKFTLLVEDFTIDNGLLTPTLKIRRNAVIARYKDEIESLYQ